MQQLLLLNAMRPERITQCMVSFTSSVLHQTQPRHKRLLSPVDFTRVAKTLRADQVPVVLFRDEPHLPVNKLQNFTKRAGVRS